MTTPEIDNRDLHVSSVDGIAGIEQFSGEIDRLNGAAGRPNPFLSSAFLKTYSLKSEYSRPDDAERLYLIRDGANLIGCAAMRFSADGISQGGLARLLPWRSIRIGFLAPLDTERPAILSAPEDEERVARALIKHLCRAETGWDMVELSGQQPAGSLYRAAHAAAGWRYRVRNIEVEPYNEIELHWNDLNGYFRSLAQKMRSNISRQARKLFAAGEAELILADGAADTTAWFDAYCELDSRSWKEGTAASIRRDPRRLEFYRDIVNGRAGLDPSFIGIILDGELIAGMISGSNASASPGRDGVWCLEMAYDKSRAELGPGQLLFLLAMGRAIENSHRHLNFMQNFSYYKHRWAARPIEVVNVQLLRKATLRNLLAHLRELHRKISRAARRAGDSPTSEAADHAPATDSGSARAGHEHGCKLASLALASMSHSVRRLDMAGARAWLPFPLE